MINQVRTGLRLLAGLLIFTLVLSQPASAGISYDPAFTWSTLRSRHFSVHFHDGEEPIARRALAIAERAHERLSRELKWVPVEPTDIVLTDGTDVTNGHAQVFPANRMVLIINPPDGLYGLEDHDGWLDTVITHEYTHIVHLDKAAGAPRFLRNFFGRHFLLFPNAYQPAWLIEGIATHEETDRTRAIGRGQSSYFDMLMRMEAQNGIKPLAQINQPIASWPAGATPYLYGVQFYDYISATRGEEKIPRLVEEYSDNLLPFFVNPSSRRALGASLTRLWPEFSSYTADRYNRQLSAIRSAGERRGEQLTRHGYYTGASRVLADGTLFYLRADARSEPALMVWRAGDDQPRHLADVHYPARFDVHPQAGILLAQPEVMHNARLHYDLYRVNPQSGSTRRITRGGRYHYAAWSPDGARIAALRQDLGNSSLQILSHQGELLETLWTGAADEVLTDIGWSPDGGSIVAAMWQPHAGWNLALFSVADRRWKLLTRDSAIEMQPRFSPDGNSILFTSDHGGVYNIRRLDLGTGRMTSLTNVTGGAFNPAMPDAGGPLYYTGFTENGFDLFRLDTVSEIMLPEMQAQAVPAPDTVTAEPTAESPEPYSPWSGLRPRWWFPHLAVEAGRAELGMVTGASDPLDRHIYSADIAYDFRNDWVVGELDYIYDRWFPVMKLRASRYNEIERDGNNDPLRVRRSDQFQAEVILPLLSYTHRWSLHATAYQVRETDGWLESGVTPLPDNQDNVAGVALVFDSTRRYLSSVSRSNGRQVQLVSENSDTLGGSDYSGEVYSVDWREFIALGGEHVLGLRLAGGWGSAQPRPFRLGGSRSAAPAAPLLAGLAYSNLFDQRDYALRGYSPGGSGLTGRRMALSSLEWRFPLRRVERGIMAPPLALHQVFGGIFVDAGRAWDSGDRPESYYTGAGVEISADTILFYNMGLDLRAGYAHGYNQGGGNQFYLRAGASF